MRNKLIKNTGHDMRNIYLTLTLISSPLFLFSCKEIAIDTRQQIFIYETIRDYNINKHEEIENIISKSILTELQKKELLEALQKQRELNVDSMANVMFPLLHRSIPSDYILKELQSLEKSGKVDSRINNFITNTSNVGYSLDGAFEFIREQIKEDRENKT